MARWYRQDGNADSNPKMIKAGFWGTVVFHALCRVSADHELGGEVSAEYADPAYLARRLRLSEDPALAPLWAAGADPVDVMRDGVTRCRHSRLVADAPDGGLIISGWPDRNEEGSSSTVRMRKKRERDRLAKLSEQARDVTGDGVTSRDSTDGRTIRTDDTDGGAGGTPSPAADAAPPPRRKVTRSQQAAAIAKGQVKPSEIAARVLARIGDLGGVRSRYCEQLEALITAGVLERDLVAVVEFKARDEFFVSKGNLNPTTLFRPSNFPGYLDAARSAPSASRQRTAEDEGLFRYPTRSAP